MTCNEYDSVAVKSRFVCAKFQSWLGHSLSQVLDPECESSLILHNISNYLPSDIAQQPKIVQSLHQDLIQRNLCITFGLQINTWLTLW
jgi:hypothetical protein